MIDRPIIFSAPMVRGLIREVEQPGRGKTQTRRILKAKPGMTIADCTVDAGGGRWELPVGKLRVPYAIGDRLWVRENGYWADGTVAYMADYPFKPAGWGWKPSIHMPRWASRLTLTVTDVRVQRLQEISEEDAIAEGIEPVPGGGWKSYETCPDGSPHPHAIAPNREARTSFRELWNSLHGPAAWGANFWIVALTFTVAQRNIDA